MVYPISFATVQKLQHYDDDVVATLIVIGLLLGLLCLLAYGFWKRPRTVGCILVGWLAWLVSRIFRGDASTTLRDWGKQIAVALDLTVQEIRLTWRLVIAWSFVLAPFLQDIWTWLEPVLEWAWGKMNETQRVICILVIIGLIASAIKVWRVYRRDRTHGVANLKRFVARILKEVLQQLSFAVLAPCIWWMTDCLQYKYSSLLVLFATDWLPLIGSLRTLMDLQQAERKVKEAPRSSTYRRLWGFTKLVGSRRDSRLDQVPELVRLKNQTVQWLSYWSCWPFLTALAKLNQQDDWIPAKYKASYDGVMMALVLWTMPILWWKGSRIMPYIVRHAGPCFDAIFEDISAVMNNVRSWLFSQAFNYSSIVSQLKQHLGTMAIAGVVVLTCLAIMSTVFQIVSGVFVLVIVIASALESARYASFATPMEAFHDAEKAKNHPPDNPAKEAAEAINKLCRKRLAFWVILLLWLQLVDIPGVGLLLDIWTPLVLVASLVVGETVLQFVIGILLYVINACLSGLISCLGTSKDDAEESGLSDIEEEDPPALTSTLPPAVVANSSNVCNDSGLQEPLLRNVDDVVQSEQVPIPPAPRVEQTTV